ncbi:isoprenoid synthase domain-containing protein [Coniella lustricola]|uniref:Isoprenoid synthase domain-containing protein n=1 Tax=Coniella lustricola TaxID=2025994 RepID=A0A2T3A9N3_9PEZI|nr:isoprenoid synthase domain-containing protein [Coniella lustricola]
MPLPSTNILLNMASSSSTPSYPPASTTTPPPPAHPDPSRFAHDDFGFIDGAARAFSSSKDRVIRGPFDYLNSQRGKDFRSQLIAAFNTWLEVPPASLEIITRVVGMLHTASLLIDDVEDNSLLRRGLPVAHALFGVPQTINSANYIYFRALEELQKLNNPRVITIFAEELLNLHRGQGLDLFWRDTLTCPTEDEYLEMVGNKTGGLFRLGIKLMQAESSRRIKRQPPAGAATATSESQVENITKSTNNHNTVNDDNDDDEYDTSQVPDCVPLVNLVGLIFQIRDDYQNLQSTEYSENKGLAEDLTEGKFSFPVIHSIRSDPGNLQLINILKQRTGEDEVKRYAVQYMAGTGSFEYTLKVLEVLIARARRVAVEIERKQRRPGVGEEGGGDGKLKNKGIEMILDKMVIGGKNEMHFPAKS